MLNDKMEYLIMYIFGVELLDKNKKPIEHAIYEEYTDEEENLAKEEYANFDITQDTAKYLVYKNDDCYITLDAQGYKDDDECGFTSYNTSIIYCVDDEIYTQHFDYNDMKIAFEIQEFYDTHKDDINFNDNGDFDTYENCIKLVVKIKNEWNTANNLSFEMWGYSQAYARQYLENNYLD